MEQEKLNAIGSDIIGASFNVRSYSGPLLRENFYKHALAYELQLMGHKVKLEQTLPVMYKNIKIADSYQMDIVVDDMVVIEIKALRFIGETERRQLFTYLKLSNYKLGYLINFGAKNFQVASSNDMYNTEKGIYRFVNNI